MAEFEPLPVDFLILEALPDQGLIGGVHYKGRLVREVRKDLIAEAGVDLETSFLQARFRSLHVAGLIRRFPGTSSGRSGSSSGGTSSNTIWARTPRGRAFMARKDEFLGGLTDDLDTEFVDDDPVEAGTYETAERERMAEDNNEEGQL